MATNDDQPPFDPAFLDDFYAECDEHLLEVRRTLLRLEEAGPGAPDPRMIEGLFRNTHSLKGILGMAGVEPGEILAHRAEDFLRALSRGETMLTDLGVHALNASAQRLEEILNAHRQRASLPGIGDVIERLESLVQRPSAAAEVTPATNEPAESSSSGELPFRIDQQRKSGKKIWRCTFSPSPELNQRGININAVRARLQGWGEILATAPKIGEGGMSFEFLVAAANHPTGLESWRAEGIRLVPVEPSEMPSIGSASVSPRGAEPVRTESGGASNLSGHFVRVDLDHLDELMQIMGDMVLYRARLEEGLTRVAPAMPSRDARVLHEINLGLARELRRLRDGLMRVRLVPVSEVFERMSLVVRDLGRQNGRKVHLAIQGQDTQIDKYVVERLKDPLLHLVRNAFTHGLESREDRLARGKSADLNITLRASSMGESVLIEVHDDGRGINLTSIKERAKTHGIELPENLNSRDVLDVLCRSGFTTRDNVDRGSGRGIGLSVVKNTVTELGGDLSLESRLGAGTTFFLRLPLTLAVADALILGVGKQQFAIPQNALQEIIKASESEIKTLETNEFLQYRDGILPLIRLTTLFHLIGDGRQDFPVMVISNGMGKLGVVVDKILGRREIVVRALSDPSFRIPGISGATELGEGRAVLILDALGLLQYARTQEARSRQLTSYEFSYA